jgi:hypothetical protein
MHDFMQRLKSRGDALLLPPSPTDTPSPRTQQHKGLVLFIPRNIISATFSPSTFTSLLSIICTYMSDRPLASQPASILLPTKEKNAG